MAENFYVILTAIGKAKLTNAQVTGTKVNLSTVKAGDGNGAYYNPTEAQIDLVNEVWSGPINQIYVDETNANWMVIEAVIPEDVGDFSIRELGIFDDAGDMIAIGKYPETYKPVLAQGSGKDLYLRTIIETANAAQVTLKVDPAVVLSTRKYVDDSLSTHDGAAAPHAAMRQRGSFKEPVRVATTENIALSGLLTIDGVTLGTNDRVLVKNQTAGGENGIYTAAAGAWTRATDADSAAKINPGMLVPVADGTVNGDSLWMLATNGAIALGNTSLDFILASDRIPGWVGLKGDGATDAGAALNHFLSANDAASIKIPSGTYKIDTALSYSDLNPLKVSISPGAHFTGSGDLLCCVTNNYNKIIGGEYIRLVPTADDQARVGAENAINAFASEIIAQAGADNVYHVAGYFGARGLSGARGDIWGVNTLVELEAGYIGNGLSLEVDVNNYTGIDGKGTGILINGVGDAQKLYGISILTGNTTSDWQAGLRVAGFVEGIIVDGSYSQAPAHGIRVLGMPYNHMKVKSSDETNPTWAQIFGTDSNDSLLWSLKKNGTVQGRFFQMLQQSADPPNPGAGAAVLWMSDGTGSGDAQDIMMFINDGSTTKTITLVDFSAH